MLGDDRDYDVVPYFFSDLADWASLEYVGPAHDWDEEVWRGDREEGEFSVWYLKDGRVAGASASSAPKTSPKRGGCSPTGSTSRLPGTRSPTPTLTSRGSLRTSS